MREIIEIVLVTLNPLVQRGLLSILSTQTGIKVLATATDGYSACEKYRQHEPDVVLLFQKPPLHALRLLTSCPAAKVLVLNCCFDATEVRRAFAAGALGYLPINAPTDMLLEAIRTVAMGRKWLSPCVMSLLMDESDNQEKENKEELSRLTKRELQVLRIIARGQTNKQIARKLSIVSRTVEFHQGNIFQKLNVTSRTEAAIWAKDHGLV